MSIEINDEKIEREHDNIAESDMDVASEGPVEAENNDVDSVKIEFEKKFNDLNDRYLRLYADFDNFKKRTAKEKLDASAYAIGGLLTKLLTVLDNLERAVNTETSDAQYYEGVKMVSNQFKEILETEGLIKIDCVGKQFDPIIHYAVMSDNDETKADNEITEELQSGYMYKDKILRPSMVKVNKIN